MDGEQHVRSHPYAYAYAYAYPNAYPDTYPNAYANAYANANHVRAVGRRQDLHRRAGGELSRCHLQGAVDPHRLRRH